MTPTSHLYDVAIVGAGPAGSTAAKLLRDSGLRVALIDKAKFPRHKTCASWVNRLAFERFPYLQRHKNQLVDVPFYGIRFFNSNLSRNITAPEKRLSGYLTLRSKFDNGLKDIAVESGVEFYEETSIAELSLFPDRVSAILSDKRLIDSRILIGADGAQSRVAELAKIREPWNSDRVCLCANEDIPYDPTAIQRFYGERFPIEVMLQFSGINGYAWLFPKKNHICLGVGARLKGSEDIRSVYQDFLEQLRSGGWIPPDLQSHKVYYAVDPAGGVNQLNSLVRGRVLLIGDAAGFVSGSTGEGIYPAMWSAQVASTIILEALTRPDTTEHLKNFDSAWRSSLGRYTKNLPGGTRRASTQRRINWIFKSALVSRIAAKVFLYGKDPDLRTALGSLWR